MSELDLFGNPATEPFPVYNKERKPKEPKPEEPKPLPENPPIADLPLEPVGIDYIVKEPIPGGVRTTIWNKTK
jgi:hypothetical protein